MTRSPLARASLQLYNKTQRVDFITRQRERCQLEQWSARGTSPPAPEPPAVQPMFIYRHRFSAKIYFTFRVWNKVSFQRLLLSERFPHASPVLRALGRDAGRSTDVRDTLLESSDGRRTPADGRVGRSRRSIFYRSRVAGNCAADRAIVSRVIRGFPGFVTSRDGPRLPPCDGSASHALGVFF